MTLGQHRCPRRMNNRFHWPPELSISFCDGCRCGRVIHVLGSALLVDMWSVSWSAVADNAFAQRSPYCFTSFENSTRFTLPQAVPTAFFLPDLDVKSNEGMLHSDPRMSSDLGLCVSNQVPSGGCRSQRFGQRRLQRSSSQRL